MGWGRVKPICELFLACMFLFLAYDDTIFSRLWLFLAKFDHFPRFSPLSIFSLIFPIFCLLFPLFFLFSLFSLPTQYIFRRLGGGVDPPPLVHVCFPSGRGGREIPRNPRERQAEGPKVMKFLDQTVTHLALTQSRCWNRLSFFPASIGGSVIAKVK